MQNLVQTNSHSNASGSENGAKSGTLRAIRPIAALVALVALLAAGQLAAQPQRVTIDSGSVALIGDFTPSGQPAVAGHRAGLLGEILDLLKQIIDILDESIPFPQRDPDAVPDEPVLDPEDMDEANDAVDEAETQGVAVPAERIDAGWNYYETRTFLSLVIDLIEDFRGGGE